MDIEYLKKLLYRYIKVYNLNEVKYENGKLQIKLIYNISKEKLSKPVYRNFEYEKQVEDPDLELLEENLSVIFKHTRAYRIADPLKIIKLLDINHSLKTETEEALEEIREKIFKSEKIKQEYMLLALSNDIVSPSCRKGVSVKYKLKVEESVFYITNLKLHTIECIESEEDLSYEELFEKISEVDCMMAKITELKYSKQNIELDTEITKEMIEELEVQNGEDSLKHNRLFKSYHNYLTNDLNREKSSEIIKYKGKSYEIVKIRGDGYIIIRQPEKRIVTDDKLIDRIVIKYKMLHGELN